MIDNYCSMGDLWNKFIGLFSSDESGEETTEQTTAAAQPQGEAETKTEAVTETVTEAQTEAATKLVLDTDLPFLTEETTAAQQETVSVEDGEASVANGGNFQAVILAVCVFAVLLFAAMKIVKKKSKNNEDITSVSIKDESFDSLSDEKIGGFSCGKLHNIGKRKSQQDSFGTMPLGNGIVAVVADGMGGLSDGDKVSQRVVMSVLEGASQITSLNGGNPLFSILAKCNRDVNRMLGASNQYRSGSTLTAVLAVGNIFHWVSVGDSRIYLYRNGRMLQLNTEHNYETELILNAVNGSGSFAKIKSDPDRQKLTSFIGMGNLKYVDGSIRPIALQEGDRILLMSDGVFNAVSEGEMSRILAENNSAATAAQMLERKVTEYNKPKQDNFTAVIIGVD